jgi:ABC-type transport system involved in cytochrome bd biosynthesis fused ATPase/permease subunit
MKKNTLTIAILFIVLCISSVSSIFAQSPAIETESAISVNVPAVDTLIVQASVKIEALQSEVDQFVISTQSDRIAFYGLQKQLAEARQQYYTTLAAVSPDQASFYKQTAWQFRKSASAYAAKQYAAIPAEDVAPVHLGRLSPE